MKKFFTLAALALCALTINAQTTISFSEVKAGGSLDGQTITSTLEGFSLTVTDTKKRWSLMKTKPALARQKATQLTNIA